MTTTTAAKVREDRQPYRKAATPGFLDGTSGGPWFLSIGGNGSPSYSPVRDGDFTVLLQQAIRAASG
jgi:hypothetical protein